MNGSKTDQDLLTSTSAGWPIHRAAMGGVTMIERRRVTNPAGSCRQTRLRVRACHPICTATTTLLIVTPPFAVAKDGPPDAWTIPPAPIIWRGPLGSQRIVSPPLKGWATRPPAPFAVAKDGPPVLCCRKGWATRPRRGCTPYNRKWPRRRRGMNCIPNPIYSLRA